MRYGTCISPRETERVAIVKAAGYDYIETDIKTMYNMSVEEIRALAEEMKRNDIVCECANCFIGHGVMLVGDTANDEQINAYLDNVLPKCAMLDMRVIVFGSGGSRNRPEGFGEDRAYAQLVHFLRDIAGVRCAGYGISIAVEPLIFRASNMIHFVAEAVQLARDSGCANVGGLADIYHMVDNGDEVSGILKYKGELLHSHISNPHTRNYPLSADEYDYSQFIAALAAAGCERCTIEAETEDFENDVVNAYKLLSAIG